MRMNKFSYVRCQDSESVFVTLHSYILCKSSLRLKDKKGEVGGGRKRAKKKAMEETNYTDCSSTSNLWPGHCVTHHEWRSLAVMILGVSNMNQADGQLPSGVFETMKVSCR